MGRILLLILLATCSVDAVSSIKLYRKGNATSHCSATRLTRNVVLTLADCLYNSTTKKAWPMLKADGQMITRTDVLAKWKNTTDPLNNFAVAFIGGSGASVDDVMWSAYSLEEEACIRIGGKEKCPGTNKGARDSLSLGGSTVVDLGRSANVAPGEAVLLKTGHLFAIVLPQRKCDNGWRNTKDQCGLRITKLAFDFICAATSNGLPACSNATLKHGTDEEPTLLSRRSEYNELTSLAPAYGVILIYCDSSLCFSGNCKECSLCSNKSTQYHSSLDRIVGLRKQNFIVRRVDLDILPAQVEHVPLILIRMRNSRDWHEYRGPLSRLITDVSKNTLNLNSDGLTKLDRLPALSNEARTKRVVDGEIFCGYCGGINERCEGVFMNERRPNFGRENTICVRSNDNQAVYAVNYNCRERISTYVATRLNVNSRSDGRLPSSQGGRFTTYLDTVIHRQHQSTDADYRGSRASQLQKGHLISDRYMVSNNDKMTTYFYINAVPQFSSLNGGQWATYEGELLDWIEQWCAGNTAYVIVGAVPSTDRYLGRGKTAREQNDIYRVNVPTRLYTASCCVAKQGGGNSVVATTFYSENNANEVFTAREEYRVPTLMNIFPGQPACSNLNNFKMIVRS